MLPHMWPVPRPVVLMKHLSILGPSTPEIVNDLEKVFKEQEIDQHTLVKGNGSSYMCKKCSMVGDISDLQAIPCASEAEAAGKELVAQFEGDEALAAQLLQEEMQLCLSMGLALELEIEEQMLSDLMAEEEALKKFQEQAEEEAAQKRASLYPRSALTELLLFNPMSQ